MVSARAWRPAASSPTAEISLTSCATREIRNRSLRKQTRERLFRGGETHRICFCQPDGGVSGGPGVSQPICYPQPDSRSGTTVERRPGF